MNIVDKMKSQIGDDPQYIFDHEALFKLAVAEIERLRAVLEEIDMRGKQYAAEELADMARAVLDGKDPESVFNTSPKEGQAHAT